jgi:YD repeat-containing protein
MIVTSEPSWELNIYEYDEEGKVVSHFWSNIIDKWLTTTFNPDFFPNLEYVLSYKERLAKLGGEEKYTILHVEYEEE